MYRQSPMSWDGVIYVEDRLNILLSMDETSRYLSDRRMGDHPVSWVRKMGNGLAAFNSIGNDNTAYGTARSGSGLGVDSMAQAYLWNLIRFLGRDFQGCTDPDFQEYVPWASVRTLTPGDAEPCMTPVSIFSSGKGDLPSRGVSAFAGGMIRVKIPEAGFYRIHVSDMRGRQVHARTVIGGVDREVEIRDMAKGSYVVQVTRPPRTVNVVRVNL
jgi:hypothetical protein